MKLMKYLLPFFLISLFFTDLEAQIATEFGKNRVQYHDFVWFHYETPHFMTYYARKDVNVGKFALQVAEIDFRELQNLLEYRISGKIDMIVYTDLTDLKQSNIGSEAAFQNTGGVTKIVDNKMFVYFDGNHDHLRRQIREGIARVFLNHMLFGGNLQEIVQNAMLLNLPEWFTEGVISYVAEDWNSDMDNRLRDMILGGKFQNFNDIANHDPRFAGHAFWYYIAQSYGKNTVSNLLYLTRINRSEESGFLYVMGTSFKQTSLNCMEYFRKRYSDDMVGRTMDSEETILNIKQKKNQKFTQFKISPNAKHIAYIANDIGRAKVMLYNIKEGKSKVIFATGFRNNIQATDYNYPLLSWAKTGKRLSVIYEKQDDIKLMHYDLQNEEKSFDRIAGIERILNADYINNKKMVVTAISNGYSNLYLYSSNSGFKRISRDFYDYKDAKYVELNGKKGILFASNRPDNTLVQAKLDTILPLATYDIFFYDLESKSNELIRITDTPFANEMSPIQIDRHSFGFLSDENGVYNRYVAEIDTIFSHNEITYELVNGDYEVIHEDSTFQIDSAQIDTSFVTAIYVPAARVFANTDYHSGILQQHSSWKKGKVLEYKLASSKHQLHLKDLDANVKTNPLPTFYRGLVFSRQPAEGPKEVIDIELEDVEKTKIELEDGPERTDVDESIERELELEDDLAMKSDTTAPEPEITANEPDTVKIDIDNYFFQSDFEDLERPLDQEPAAVIIEEDDGEITLQSPQQQNPELAKAKYKPIKFVSSKSVPYRLRFKANQLTTQLDNSLLFGGLESYNANSLSFLNRDLNITPYYNSPPMGLLFKTSVEDILEDYRFTAGVRVPFAFNGMEYFLTFEDNKKRLDKRFSFYRRSNTDVFTENGVNPLELRTRNISHLGEVLLKYPLDVYRSVRFRTTLRNDKTVVLASRRNIGGLEILNQPDVNEQSLNIRAEYVFDNTIDKTLNIKNGSRYKFFAEINQQFDLSLVDSIYFDINRGFMARLGIDARHYQRLDKHSIFAVRFAGETTIGTKRILYYLGGTENWINPRINTDIPVATNNSFLYTGLAANLRGFKSNIRNGGSYALVNAELRVPVFHYLYKRTPRSAILRNFQLIGFFDAGTAWEGISPFAKDNPLNTVVIDPSQTAGVSNPVKVTVNYFRNPIVAGYGIGARTTLFGYFLRFDYAWGIETGEIQDPIFYCSFGLDF